MHGVPERDGRGYAGVFWGVLPGVKGFCSALPMDDVTAVGQ
jgi:hypothetical protein